MADEGTLRRARGCEAWAGNARFGAFAGPRHKGDAWRDPAKACPPVLARTARSTLLTGPMGARQNIAVFAPGFSAEGMSVAAGLPALPQFDRARTSLW